MNVRRIVFFSLSALLSQGVFADSALPAVDRIRPDEAPAVDGRLDDAVWSRLTWRSDFRRLPGDVRKDPLNPTSFAMAVDDHAVYFGIRADCLDVDAFRAAKPKSIWVTDDCEVMLSPSGSSFEFYQFAVAAKGGIREAEYHYEGGFTHPDPYAPEWRSAVALTETGYTVEIAVPFSALYMTRGEKWSDVWRVNVARSSFSGKRQAVTWSPLRTTFIDPENYNRIAGFPHRRIEEDVRIAEAVPEIRRRTAKGYEGDVRVSVYVARGGEFELSTPYGDKAKVVLKRGENMVRVSAVFPERKRYQLPLTLVRTEDSTRVHREYPVAVEFEPIRIRLNVPGYADCFYPGQDASRISGRVESALDGKVSVVCGNGKSVELPCGGGEFSFDVADGLKDEVVLTAICGTERCQKTVRKIKPDGHRLSWVENGNLVVDGKPVFRRNFYAPKLGVSKAFEARFAADGFHLTSEVTSGGCFEPHRLLGREDEARGDAPPSPEMLSKVDEVLEKAKGRDFAYYYISDEPECRSLSPVYLKHVYDYVKRKDPRHVILMVTRDPVRFADCYDWVEPHPYLNPFYDRGQRKHFTPMNRMASFLDGCVGRPDKVVGFTPMVFSYEEGSSANDFPTFGEYLCNVWTMLAHGAKTIYPFRGGTLAERPGIYEGARFANASIEALEDYLLSGKRSVLVRTPDYEVARWDLGKKRLFAAVSLSWTNVTAMASGLGGRWYRFRSSDRSALDLGDVARLGLAPFEVLVATSDPTCGAKLQTIEETLEKVVREEQVRTHRDNQMFGRRTEVEFAGSSPFWGKSTIFNGMHDDFVARFKGTNEWLEIAFPKAAISFERLLLWGENMEGVGIKIREGGEWRELTPVKTVAQDGGVEFAFGRVIRTVRVRLEFRRPGMLLSEVEFPRVTVPCDVRSEVPVGGERRTAVAGEFVLDGSNAVMRTKQSPLGWYGTEAKVEPLPDGGFRVSGTTASRPIRFLPEWKWLEVDLRDSRTTSEGFRYRSWGLNLIKYMGYVVNDGYVVRPGLWTIPLDPHDKPIPGCLSVADRDYDLDFGYLRFSPEPPTRFLISKSGTGPMKKGDVLCFDLVLEHPCEDVTCILEHLSQNQPKSFAVNGLTSVAMRRVDAEGRHWRAEVAVRSLDRVKDVPTARAVTLGGSRPLTVMTRFPAKVADEAGILPVVVGLAQDKRPKAEIVLGERPSKVARFAALELKAHLDLMTGADFRIVGETGRTSGVYPIFVGTQRGTREHDVAALGEQEHVVDVSAERTILLGRERSSDMPVELVYEPGSVTCVRKCLNKPTMWEPRGSLNAVYDFLHDRCGVSWTTCTEAGSCVPRKDSLSVACGVTRYSPFLKGREVQLSPEEWADFRNPEQYARYLSVAYPWASAQGDPKRKVQLTKELFVLRLKAGGERRIANHSFYGYYDRFLNRNSKAFEGYHPEYFSRHRLNKKADRAEGGEIFAPVDTAHKPAQLCYTNEKLIGQVIRDARAYFDRVAANEKAGLPPSAHWGRDTFCLEPMDNGQFCECDDCLKLRRPDRKELRAEMSDYWFTFVNRIARAVKESHPGRKVSTLAYGTAREGMPSFPVEDNVTVHFCWSDNRSPHLNPLDGRQVAPLAPFAARGMIWYQGEADVGVKLSGEYEGRMHELYRGWSKAFENPDWKLYFVQIPPFVYYNQEALRVLQQGQRRFADAERNAAMTVITDVADPTHIHPLEKETVGRRLALHALRRDYGFGLEDESPRLKEWKIEGGEFRLTFDHLREAHVYYHTGMWEATGPREPDFEIAGADGVWHPADVVNRYLEHVSKKGVKYYEGRFADGNLLRVSSPAVKEPKKLRYLHSKDGKAVFYNEMTLPCGPFEVGE